MVGLNGALILRNNGGDDITITANGGFAFSDELRAGEDYLVSILTRPIAQNCNVVMAAAKCLRLT